MKKTLLVIVALGIALGSPALAAGKKAKAEAPKPAPAVAVATCVVQTVGVVASVPFQVIGMGPIVPISNASKQVASALGAGKKVCA